IAEVTDTEVVARGMAHDLERNSAMSVEVRRRIVDKNNNRFRDDMIIVTGNAAISIAIRNAVFRVIPRCFADQIYRQCREVADGKADALGTNRAKAFDALKKLGATEENTLARLGRASVDDVTRDDVSTRRGIFSALRDGETTVEQAFPD